MIIRLYFDEDSQDSDVVQNARDLNRIHIQHITQNKPHAGIIIGQQQRYSVGEQMRRLTRIVNARTAEQMINQLEFLSNWG